MGQRIESNIEDGSRELEVVMVTGETQGKRRPKTRAVVAGTAAAAGAAKEPRGDQEPRGD